MVYNMHERNDGCGKCGIQTTNFFADKLNPYYVWRTLTSFTQIKYIYMAYYFQFSVSGGSVRAKNWILVYYILWCAACCIRVCASHLLSSGKRKVENRIYIPGAHARLLYRCQCVYSFTDIKWVLFCFASFHLILFIFFLRF